MEKDTNIKLIIEIPQSVKQRLDEEISEEDAKSVGWNIASAIRLGVPYDEAEVWRKSNELLEKRLKYLSKFCPKCGTKIDSGEDK